MKSRSWWKGVAPHTTELWDCLDIISSFFCCFCKNTLVLSLTHLFHSDHISGLSSMLSIPVYVYQYIPNLSPYSHCPYSGPSIITSCLIDWTNIYMLSPPLPLPFGSLFSISSQSDPVNIQITQCRIKAKVLGMTYKTLPMWSISLTVTMLIVPLLHWSCRSSNKPAMLPVGDVSFPSS